MANTAHPSHSGTGRPPAASAAASNPFDPWILWVTFRRCWAWAVPIGTVLACIAAFVVFESFVPTYRASHLLEANNDYLVFKGVMPTMENIAATENPLFFNPIVIDPVLADPALRKAPSLSDPETAEANLREKLKVSSGGTDTRMLVSYEDTDPQAAAIVCNAVVDSYLRQRDSFDSTRVSNLERWLEPEIERWQKEVELRQQNVRDLSQQTLGYAPGQRLAVMEDQNNLSLVADLRAKITDLNVELALNDARRAMQAEAGNETAVPAPDESPVPEIIAARQPTEAEIAAVVAADPAVREAQALIDRYRAVLLNLEDRDMVRLRREYYQETQAKHDQWVAHLNTAKQDARQRAAALVSERAVQAYKASRAEAQLEWVRQREDQLLQDQQERQTLLAKLDVLQQQYDQERLRLEQFGGTSAELQFAQEELSVATGVLTKLRDRSAAIRTERRTDGAVRTLAEATPPKAPVETVPVKKLVAASGAAFCIPFLLGLLWEFRVQRVTDSSVVDGSNRLAPVVGEVARLPAGERSARSRRIFEESVDSLRANLFYSIQTKNARSIAVVSSLSGEGKSSVASQLALSIAKATGETVLLVDADLRRPDQHEIFGLEMGPGLCGVLSKQATLEDAIDTSLGNLIHVLPAGSLNNSPHRLINQSAMRDFVDGALERYTFVVFDTAPVLSASESVAVAAAVDATLLCAMRDVSRMESMTRSMRRLEAAGASVAGTVFSGVTARQYAYRYGNYHYALAAEPPT